MSFNIRYGTANDGANHWDKRKELVVETIAKFAPDLLGTQETWNFQADYLQQHLTDYTYVGRSRDAKPGRGEQCGLMYKTDRFDCLEQGHFWLSEKPDRPGSKSWDSSLPRMVTWVKLWDSANQCSLHLFNTHFDHRGKAARRESASLIRKRVNSLTGDINLIVTGDFNASVDSAPYRELFNSPGRKILDTYRHLDNPVKDSGTFNGFSGKTDGARIDWIGVSSNWSIDSAQIDRRHQDGRYPSDHFPVTAVIRPGK